MSDMCQGCRPHLQTYLELVADFIQHCQKLDRIQGYSKLEKKCRAERKFLKSLNFKSQTIQENHLQSSNLNHYAGVLYMSSRLPNVSCILQPFSVRSRKRGSLVVDVVCSHGLDWVKVIARKAQALHLVWAGQGQFGDRDLMVQAQDYLRCAVQHPVNYIVPKVHFVFFNAITEPMATTLTQLGIEVHGDVVAVEPDTQTKLESVQEISDCSSDSDDSQNLSEEELTGAVSSDNPGSNSGKARGGYLSQEGLSLSDKSMEALKEYSEGELTGAVHSVIPGSDSGKAPGDYLSQKGLSLSDKSMRALKKYSEQELTGAVHSVILRSDSGTTEGDYLSQAGLSLSSAINKSMEALKEYSEGEFSERHSLNSWSRFSWLPFIVQKSFTLQNCTGLGKQVPEPLHSEGSSESNRDEGFVSHITRVNLDITTLITLVSAVSHGRCHFVFPEKILTMQAEEERQSPVLPRLVKFMEGKKLYCCQTAVSDFEAILATLGGESERERAKDLLSQVEIVPDQPSERSRSLPVTGKLKIRSKIIFGTGDHLQAITMTANTGYVRAAENHGVSFAVFPHASRALTEMKEKTATPLKTDPQKTKFLPKE